MAITAIVLAGCGGGSDASAGVGGASSGTSRAHRAEPAPSRRYDAQLRQLRHAAAAGSTYQAVHRARELAPRERATIEAFCEFAWQIGVNREAAKLSEHAYVVGRIRTAAETGLNPPHPVGAAMGRLRRTLGLESLDARRTARYAKACES